MPVITTPQITLGDQVRLRRVAMGLSQRQLGEQIGFTQQYVAYVEGSTSDPAPDTQAALEKALGGVELNSPAMQLATSILLDRCRFDPEQQLALTALLGCCGE